MAKKKVWGVGHKHPDTDSICAAISYANLKNEIEKKNPKTATGMTYIAKRAGSVNAETAYVLERFHAEAPAMISDVGTQIKDIQIRRTEGVNSHISMKKAWEMMKILGVVTLPVVRENKLEGLIVTGDIANSYMDVYDNTILSTARTQYKNIVETLDGQLLTGNEHAYFVHGKVVIGIGTPEGVTSAIDKDDLVMIGDGEESQMLSIASNCSCMIVTNGYEISQEVIEAAKEREVVLISTPYDTFTAARLINQRMPTKHFMTKKGIIHFDLDDYVDEVRETVANIRHRDFPVLDENQNYVGMFSRRNLMKAEKKKLKELYKRAVYGQYAMEDGRMRVAFLSTNDITGGNSGSPVLNGKGELIGTAFDGNWEAMSGDIIFEPNLQRTISVDIRYTLFIMDKFGGAAHLLNEMTIVK